MTGNKSLNRVITLPWLVLYGVGTILGAGIYALIGKIAGLSGEFAPFSFLFSGLIAAFVALTYAELSSRFPESAGEAAYVYRAFLNPWLSALVGWGIVFTGIVSAAVMARGFHGYLIEFIDVPVSATIVLFVALITGIAISGIGLSVNIAGLITVIEISGIVIVIYVTKDHLFSLPQRWHDFIPPFSWPVWKNIILGAFLAFYAFIGFEDMVNVAEEVVEPEKTLPTAIILALIVATFCYVMISLAAVSTLPVEKLAHHNAPFVLITQENSDFPVSLISLISLVAILNGAMVQIIMGSRVLYGMSEKGIAPRIFKSIHPTTRTPTAATIFFAILLLILALGLPLAQLAKMTSFVILSIFALVNMSLFKIKLRDKNSYRKHRFTIPVLVPGLGFLLCVGFILLQF